jgi:single-stranded DNA-binding protein
MATINLTGRLIADVKISNGWSNFTVAENKRFNSGEKKETNFFNCKAKLSDALADALKKGSKVEVVGDFNFETYEKDGVKYYNHSVFVYHVNFVSDSKKKQTEETPEGK